MREKIGPLHFRSSSPFRPPFLPFLVRFLQEYRTVGILGCSTDSYDSEGAIVDTAPWEHLTREDVENVLDRFRGEILQMPPMFVAAHASHFFSRARSLR